MPRLTSVFKNAPADIQRLLSIPWERWTDLEIWQLFSWLFYGEPAKTLWTMAILVMGDLTPEDVVIDFLYDLAPRREAFIQEGLMPTAHSHSTFPEYFERRYEDYLRQRLIVLRREQDSLTVALEKRPVEIPSALASQFVLRAFLGSGGMGVVYRAIASTDLIALKIIKDISAAGLEWPRSLEIAGIEPAKRGADWVECTIFGPHAVAPQRRALIQAFIHRPSLFIEAQSLAKEFDREATRLGCKGLGAPIPIGTTLTFTLDAEALEVRKPVQSVVWRGSTTSVSFNVKVPARAAVGAIIGEVTVAADGIPIGVLNFKLDVEEQHSDVLRAVSYAARHFTCAFISYASKDRDTVLDRVKVLQAVKIDFFQDVLSLEPGDRWAQELYRHIDDCDVFLLFWSLAAKRSKWVMKETRYAFNLQKGNRTAAPAIRPVLIEAPVPKPPRYLAHLHFDDKLGYFKGRNRATPLS